ncbi:MAG: carboxypeptidase-like regulatory domain-containing protein, partial [Gemmatimonadota bacterium]
MARRLVRGFIAAGVGVLATLAFLALATPAAAQQGVTTGAIHGQVLDTSGAPLGGATVTIRNVDTGASRELQTNASGRYSAGFLQTGRYNVSAEFPPNPTAERGPVRVSLGETVVFDLVVQ